MRQCAATSDFDKLITNNYIIMNTNDTETYSKGGYCSPKLEVIDLNLEVGFCQSNPGKATNDDLTEEEDPMFEWHY